MDPSRTRHHVAVVGGGIAGLAAALRLKDNAPPGTVVTLIEQARQVGGKLRTGEVGGVLVEDGAEAFLARVPGGRELVERIGLGGDLIHPATYAAAVAVGDALRPMPGGTVLGVPADFDALANSGVLSRAGLTRVRSEPAEPGDPVVDDVAAGELIGNRLGREVVERLVDPLLGGVYAGRADQLSLRATMPALAEKLTTERSLVRAARSLRAAAAGESGPVFATVQGGLSRLVSTVAYRSQAAVRTGLPARDLQPTDDGWRVIVGSTRDSSVIGADAVVLATPAAPAARLLGGVSPAAAAEIGAIDYASIALVTFVLRGTIALPPGSGALIPAAPDRVVKAVTYISQKWAEATPPGFTVLRASVGRYGEERALQLDDDELVAAVQREIAALLGVSESRVSQIRAKAIGRLRKSLASLRAPVF